jgi:hypothetical protein
MEPKEVITDPERIERITEMLDAHYKTNNIWSAHQSPEFSVFSCVHKCWTYDGDLYIALPGVMRKYDWLEFAAFTREQRSNA